MVKAAKKNLKTGAEAVRKKLSDRINNGDFGTSDQKAIAIANIPVENIPVERLPEYYELLDNLVSKRGKVSARDLNKVSDFIDSISQEIENKIGGVETLAELYDVFDSERKIESESQEYIEAKNLKKVERNSRQQALINRIEGKSKELQLDTMWLSVYVKNERAIKFYEKNEFKHTGELNFLVNGKSYDNFVLSKKI